MKIFNFFLRALAGVLLLCCFLRANDAQAQTPRTTYPFEVGGSEFYVADFKYDRYNANEQYVVFHLPFYDENGKHRWFDPGVYGHSDLGAVIEFCTVENPGPNDWKAIVGFESTGNGTQGSQSTADDWNCISARSMNSYNVWAVNTKQLSPQKYGKKNEQTEAKLTAVKDCYRYDRVTATGSSKNMYFASFKWNYNGVNEVQNKVIKFRMRIRLKETDNGTREDTWNAKPGKFIIGSPMHQPTVSQQTAAEFYGNGTPNLQDGKISLTVNVPGYNKYEDYGANGYVEFGSGVTEITNMFPKPSLAPPPPYTFNSTGGIPREWLIRGLTETKVYTRRSDVNSVTWTNNGWIYSGSPITFSGESTYINIPPYPQPESLEVSQIGDKIRLSWKMQQDVPWAGNGYRFYWRRVGDASWTPFYTNPNNPGQGPLIKPYDHTKTVETQEVYYPEGFNQGQRCYYFCVTRQLMNPNASDIYGKSYAVQKIAWVATDYAQIHTAVSTATTEGVTTSWNITPGISKSSWSYKIQRYRNGVKHESAISLDSIQFAERRYIDPYYESCANIHHSITIMDGSTEVQSIVSLPATVPLNFTGEITSLSVSKGYYNNRVEVIWNVAPGSGYSKFTVSRKVLNDNTYPEELLTEVLPTSLTRYAFTDNTAHPGAYYTYFLRGWVVCNGTTSMQSEVLSTGFMQPYGTVSGRVDSPSGMMQEGVTIRAGFDPESNGGGLNYENKSFSLNNGNYMTTSSLFDPPFEGTEDFSQFVQAIMENSHLFENTFTFQAWYKKETMQACLFSHKGYFISINADNAISIGFYGGEGGSIIVPGLPKNMYTFSFKDNVEGDGTQIYRFPIGEFKHISITFALNGLHLLCNLYIDGKLVSANDISNIDNSLSYIANLIPLIGSLNPGLSIGSMRAIFLGKFAESGNSNGFIDEFRLWNRVLDSTTIKKNWDGYLSGNEEGLKAYYRFDELDDLNEVFDISGRFGVFNENHGIIANKNGASPEYRSTIVPSEEQLSIKTITDAQGNYILNTIPYSGTSTWKIVPSLGMEGQSFEPNSRSASLSMYSNTLNNYNFTNNSVTKISGYVAYEGGTYPVADCTFEIDGKAIFRNGQLVTSDAEGKFSFDVPNGVHSVRVVKFGHTFANNGYLVGSNGNNLNYVGGPQNDIWFWDKTRVKLIGHIVGGYVEHTKPSGFGLRNNNIGATTLTLTAASAIIVHNFASEDTVFYHDHVYRPDSSMFWKDHPERKNLDENSMLNDSTVVSIADKTITITVSPETGEYVAWVYPEVYYIEDIKVSNNINVYTDRGTLDLRKAVIEDFAMLKKSIASWPDSLHVPAHGSSPEYWQPYTAYDTMYYNHERSFYYQPAPTFTIAQVNQQTLLPVLYFGEKELSYVKKAGTTELIDLISETEPYDLREGTGYTFQTPIFRQGKYYNFELEAFEEYKNTNRTPVRVDQVPVKGGVVSFYGSLLEYEKPPVTLNEYGKGYFSFTGGKPNLSDGINNLTGVIRIGGIPFYSKTFGANLEAVLLGASVTGTNFVTAATDELDLILHDPPGSNSYAYVEAGSYTKIKKTFTEDKTGFDYENTVYHLGFSTFSLTGCLVEYLGGEINQTDNSYEYTDVIETKISDDTFIETTTFTDMLKTSSSPDFVGHQGDIFVGRGTNTLYGISRNVTILAKNDVAPSDVVILNTKFDDSDYRLVRADGMMMGVQFGTQFYFTTHNLINIQIPAWKSMRDHLLIYPGETSYEESTLTKTLYVSQLPPESQYFGVSNPQHPAYNAITNPEPSYKIYMPSAKRQEMANGMTLELNADGECRNCKENIHFTDSIIYFNNNIKMWEKHLADNEKRKVDHKNKGYDDNISFGGGVTIEKSETKENSTTTFSSDTKDEYIYKFSEFGITYMGVGYTTTKESEWTIITTTTEENTNTNTSKIGFVLQDNGMNDQISVDWGYDEVSPVTTYMFYKRGGQTSCPYEGEEITQYYLPGTSIGTGTMQMEVPKIDVDGDYNMLNVPAHKPAYFTLKIMNESESNNTGWFVLKVVESTNRYGAILKIDGMPIADGRHFIVPSGANQVLYKTLTVEQGRPDIFEYKGIELILSSVCEPALYDTVKISVDYIPACSDIDFQTPHENWIMNIASNEEIEVKLVDFNRNIANFEYIALQYRPISNSQWSTEKYFVFHDSIRVKHGLEVAETTILGSSEGSINTKWIKDVKPDGIYELCAKTYCAYTSALEYITPPIRGIVDTRRPQSMGTSPSNGILAAGDELSVTFNEDIQTGILADGNFSISGILNAQELEIPTSGLNFTGGDKHAETEMQIYANGSFSIETWFRIDNTITFTEGMLFAYGHGDNFISLKINADRQVVVSTSDTSFNSGKTMPPPPAINNDGTWKYISMSYDRAESKVYVCLLDGDNTQSMFSGGVVFPNLPTAGTLVVGNNGTKTNGFRGNMARVHFYSNARINPAHIEESFRLEKSGREPHLIGYWECAEGEGNIVTDKARNRHLNATHADWYRYPEGHAMRTSGADFFQIHTASYPMGNYDSFTIEFWFRNDGNPDTDSLTLFGGENGYVRINKSGLYLCKKDSVLRTITTDSTLMNGTYRHFAMSVRRSGNVTFYIDGVSVGSFSEQVLGNFNTTHLFFGVRYHQKGYYPLAFNHHFKGYFDEIRIWTTALTRDNINFYNKTKLRGEEASLVAYYPFEKWNRLTNGLIEVGPSTQNLVNDGHVALDQDSANLVLAPIGTGYQVKTERMVTSITPAYVASNNKIVFNIDPDYYAQVEGVVLDITVRDILDLRGNKCDAINWTAFVRRNPLRWDEDPISIVMQEGETRTFTARILNTSGTQVNYVINEIPGWLTVTGGSGTLLPTANRILTFTINSGINVGNYEEAIGITSGNGVTEYLPLQVKVTRQKPNWEVNPNEFESSMNIIGQLHIDNLPLQDVEDLLGAFIGEKCVGLASPILANGAYRVFATIYGDSADNADQSVITFKLWQASTGEVYPIVNTIVNKILTTIKFKTNEIEGSYADPVIFNALSNMREQHIELRNGWNMISINVLASSGVTNSILDQVKTSLADVGEMVKSQKEGYIQTPPYWGGLLNAISEKEMYMIKVNANHNMTISGTAASLNTQIPIVHDWNWIGYIPSLTMPIADALAGFDAKDGDLIKDQTTFATYYDFFGIGFWVGNLTHMKAGSGYMYKSTDIAGKYLKYPENYVPGKGEDDPYEDPVEHKWIPNPNLYDGTMTMTALVLDGKTELCSELIEIAAFCEDECRGSVLLRYEPMLDKYVGYLMIYGVADEVIRLKVYDHIAQREYAPTNAPLSFQNNAIIGNPITPYHILLPTGTTGVGDVIEQQVSIHPNPVGDALFINHPWNSIGYLEVTDMLGRIVLSEKEFTSSSLNVSQIPTGFYMLRIISNGEIVNLKFVKE